MHLCLVRLGLSCREEKRLSQKVFNNSCGTLIWVGIIAVKVDRSLILIIRTYITVYILYCSTKTFCSFSISFERKSAGVLFTSILRSHKGEIIHAGFHAFMLSSTRAFMS